MFRNTVGASIEHSLASSVRAKIAEKQITHGFVCRTSYPSDVQIVFLSILQNHYDLSQ